MKNMKSTPYFSAPNIPNPPEKPRATVPPTLLTAEMAEMAMGALTTGAIAATAEREADTETGADTEAEATAAEATAAEAEMAAVGVVVAAVDAAVAVAVKALNFRSRCAIFLLVCTTLCAAQTIQQANTDARAAELIRLLNLKPLPKESGYLGIIGVSAQTIQLHGKTLALQSQNYYLLTRALPLNYLHWLAPDDTHILIEGGPVDYYIFHPDGRVELQVLGMDLAHGQRPVVAVPGGCWKALRLHKGAAYALMANALSPEFTPDRVRIGAGAAFIAQYKDKAPWATEATLKELIGPNWIP
jgi:predicted cupin superfamily sugar epimerase